MQFHHRLLVTLYPLLRIKNAFLKKISVKSRNELRVLLYHDIPADRHIQFASQLRMLKRRWNFVTPREFEEMSSGRVPIKGPNLLLTFDDGFISNKEVAERILLPLGIKAIFFVVSDFISIQNPANARQYVSEHIYPGMIEEVVPLHWTNMNWDDLAGLIRQGHMIGAHTKTHRRISSITDKEQLNAEIRESANSIEERLGISVRHFAFPFGNIDSFSLSGFQMAKDRFDFVYSGLRGDNNTNSSAYAIRRDSVTPNDPDFLVSSFLEGGADFQYSKSRKMLDSWVCL